MAAKKTVTLKSKLMLLGGTIVVMWLTAAILSLLFFNVVQYPVLTSVVMYFWAMVAFYVVYFVVGTIVLTRRKLFKEYALYLYLPFVLLFLIVFVFGN
jgi:hypothetical protein